MTESLPDLPWTDTALSDWLCSRRPETLEQFIADADAVLESHLVLATVVGAVRRWLDEGVEPVFTLRAIAPDNFYEEEQG